MARYAVIDGGVVVNVVEADQEFAQSNGWVEAPTAAIGDLWDGESFAPPAEPGADLGAIWGAIKAERDRRTQEGGYQAAGHWYHSDTFSRTQQLGLVMLGSGMPEGLQWKTMSGDFVAMTPTLAQAIFAAATASDVAHFAHAEQLHAQVLAAEDPASVDIYSGWPPIFGEA